MALNSANGLNTKHQLLALSHLAGKTVCPVWVPASLLHLLWVPPSGTIFISEAEGSRHPLLFPSRLHPTLHIVGELLSYSKSGRCHTHLTRIALPSPSTPVSISRLFSSPANTLGFPSSLGETGPSLSFRAAFQIVFNWKESSLRAGFLLLSASPTPRAGGSTRQAFNTCRTNERAPPTPGRLPGPPRQRFLPRIPRELCSRLLLSIPDFSRL